MRKLVGKMALAGALAAVAFMGAAVASPTCSTINVLPSNGQSTIQLASFTSGYCVQIHDKLYGNFKLSQLPASTVVMFNLNSIGAKDYYQIAFSGAYSNHSGAGKTYNWSYEIAVTGAPPGTKIIELDADFSQTAGGPSTLTEDLTPGGVGVINESKTGAFATGTTQYFFSPGTTDLMIAMHLFDKGTVSSVTNTVVQFVPSRNQVPEPLSLSLLGAGLAGLSLMRRKRRS